MITIPGYITKELLYSGSSSTVYRGFASDDNTPVIIKVSNKENPSQEDIAKTRREYIIAEDLNIEGVVNPIALVPFQQSYALIMEDFGGTALNTVIAEQNYDLLSRMQIVHELAGTLAKIHQKGIIHKDIKPSNIIFNRKTGEVKITDFSIASHIFGEREALVNPDLLEGTLAYISPEQTGRMNRSIDQRADLYSFGVMMYEIFTGLLPFSTGDALELIHSHMAVIPIPPREHNSAIPEPLSDIILKLLNKNAEDRYRSAFGLRHDLEKCLAGFNSSGTVKQFTLGTRDIPTTLQIPEKLYGRERELDELINAFAKVSIGKTEMIMVKGSAGIGKSVLINELHKPVIEQKGYFAAGKFEQFKHGIPYSALRQAFQKLSQQLLSERTEKIAEWRENILNALGSNGQIIVDIIPEIELIIGNQQPLEPLPPTQSQNRFNMVFTKFVRVFANQKHPLVLFLDDVQWADPATLKLMEMLAVSPDTKSLLLIVAYRDKEVGPAHPLTTTMDDIIKTGVTTREIFLEPLSLKGTIELITDTLACEKPEAERLADLVMSKTHGNPFFINHFMKNLYQRKMIHFDTERYSWSWDTETIQAADITSNVVEFLCNNIQQLSPSARGTLVTAACIGNKFDLDLLTALRGSTVSDTATALRESQLEGLLIPVGVSYKYIEGYTEKELPEEFVSKDKISYMFLHDRIQQAAYSLIPDDRKKELHHRVGTIMLEQTPEDEMEERLFEIVQHLNLSDTQHLENSELTRLSGLNLKACQKAKTSNAYDTALEFADKGLILLGNNSWQDNYVLCRDLSMEKAECSYLLGKFNEAESVLTQVLEKARTNEEKARVYDLKTVIYALGNIMDSVRAGLAGLRLLGIHVPEKPGKLRVVHEFIMAFFRLRGRKPGDLLSLHEMTDRKQKLAIRIIMNTISTAYLTNQELFKFLCLRGFNHMLKYGITDSSPYMVQTYAIALADNFGAYKSAYDFGKTAFALNEKFPNAQMRSKSTCIFGFFFSHWCRPLQEGADFVKQGFRYCVESGDLVFAGYSACTLAIYMITHGNNIDEAITETRSYQDFTSQSEDRFGIDWYALRNQFLKNLKGLTKDRRSLSDDVYDEEISVQGFKEQQNANTLFHYYLWKGIVLFLDGDFDRSCKMFEEGKHYEHGVALLPSVGDHTFYHSLSMTSNFPSLPFHKRLQVFSGLRKNLKRLKKWSSICPDNFEHKYLLVQAETNRILGKNIRVIDLYSRAITSARAYGFLQVEALANELLARFQFSSNRSPLGQVYIEEACKCYHKWGATSKVLALVEEYEFSSLVKYVESHKDKTGDKKSSTSSGSKQQIDLTTVLRASQAISEEIVLDRLLQEVLKIMIQNAGATKGFLLLEKDDNMFIEAEGTADKEGVEVLKSIPVDSSTALSAGIVNYVKRTKETVVLQNASVEDLFISDPYVKENSSKSILCIPIIKQKELIGILYLENDLLTNAFTQERTEVLSMLATQSAISIENAKLYEDVGHRFVQLQQAEKEITASLREKELLLREIHHRVKNNMQIIYSLLRLQSRQISDNKGIDILKDSQNRIKSMALIHEKLYKSKDLSHVNFNDYIKDLTGTLFQSYETHGGKIKLKITADDIWLGIDTAIPCGLLVNELVSNSIKHAFPDSREGEINVSFHKFNNEEYKLKVSDNGIGISDGLDPEKTESLGLMLITTLSKDQLNGRMKFRWTEGTEFELIFKEIKYEKRI